MLSTQDSFWIFYDLPRRTAADKVLHDKAFDIAKNLKYGGCQQRLASFVYKFFGKKSAVARANKFSGSAVKNETIPNQELVKELNKLIISKSEKRKV